ncbi:MAG: APC family permease [Candidatus Hodarchaeota archaeon]
MAKERFSLERRLGLFDSSMLVVGIVIGAGIFITTGIMAKYLPSASLILLAWIVGGLLTLAGALTYSELGASMPEAGGQYVFIREAYGPLPGFLFGWITFTVYLNGVIAYMSITFVEYFCHFLPYLSIKNIIFSPEIRFLGYTGSYPLSVGHITAILLITLLSIINFLGIRFGKTVQNTFSVIKISIIFLFIVLGVTVGRKIPIDFSLNPNNISTNQLVIGFGLALVTASLAFDGWNTLTFIGGEIRNPKRSLTLALITGTGIVTFLYVLINFVYLSALPIDKMATSFKIAEDATYALHGKTATGLISAAVVISIFGGLNGVILVGPRVYYAMALDKLFFRKVARVHRRFRTPGFAILAQAIWASILVLSGTVEQLIIFVMFIGVGSWVATASAVFVLRRKYPDRDRPYEVWGYPVVPIIFIIAASAILINTLYQKPVESLAGIGLTIIGIPAYYLWKKASHKEAPQ